MSRSAAGRTRSPIATAVLSFLFPGLGHLYLGRRRIALLFALPVLVVALVLGIQAFTGPEALLVFLVTPTGALTVLVLVVLLAAWRLIALADAVTAATARRSRSRSLITNGVAGVLVLCTVAMHAYAAQVSFALYEASSDIFVGGGPDDGKHDAPSGAPPSDGTPDDPADDYVAMPVEPEAPDERINILLTGIDSAETRSHSLTDTLLVVSVDPTDGSVAMISFPRDISRFPLWDGRTYEGKINSLMSWARSHPDAFPDGPFPSLVKEIGFLLGAPIHYYAAVDMAGLRLLVDAVGGVTVDNPRAIHDPAYDWLDGTQGFTLPAGPVTLDGRTALAYVRSRQGAGDNDYTRARRQQQLLLALRDRLATPAMLARLPEIVEIGGRVVKTNLPADQLEEMVVIARSIQGDSARRIVLGPPYAYHPPSSTTGGIWTLRLDMDRLADLSIELFGDDSRYATH